MTVVIKKNVGKKEFEKILDSFQNKKIEKLLIPLNIVVQFI